MADTDALERAAISRINSLFASVTAEAGRAATGLSNVAGSTRGLTSSLSSVAQAFDYSGSSVSAAAQSHMDAAAKATKTWAGAGMAAGGALANAADNALGKAAGMLGKGANEGANVLGGALSGAGSKLGGFGSMLGAVTTGGGFAGKALGLLKGAVGLAATAVGALATFGQDMFKNWQHLSRVGINLGGDFTRIGVAASEARLSTQQLGQHLSKNAESLALFGGIAGEGAEQFISLQKNMQDAGRGYRGSATSFRMAMEQIGVNADESMALIGDMVGEQVFAASFRKRSEQDQAEMTADYINQLDQLSKLTGKSREQLASERKKAAGDAQFMAAMEGKTAEEMQAMQDAMAKVQELGGPAAVEVFKARLAGVVPSGKEARMLMSTPMGRAAEEMASEMRNASGADAIKGISGTYMDTMQDAAKETKGMMRPFALAGGLVDSFFKNTYEQSVTTSNRIDAIMDALGGSQDELTGKTRTLTDAFGELYDKTVGTRTDPETGEKTGAGTRGTEAMIRVNAAMTDSMLKLSGYIAKIVGSDTGAGLLETVETGVKWTAGKFGADVGFSDAGPWKTDGTQSPAQRQQATLSVDKATTLLGTTARGGLAESGTAEIIKQLRDKGGMSQADAGHAAKTAQLNRLATMKYGDSSSENLQAAQELVENSGDSLQETLRAVWDEQKADAEKLVQDQADANASEASKFLVKDASKTVTQEINEHATAENNRLIEALGLTMDQRQARQQRNWEQDSTGVTT